MPSSPARQLLDLISTSLTTLEESCGARGVDIPDLHSPFDPSTEAFRADAVASEAANVISAAALQLAAIFVPPQVSIFRAVAGHMKAAAMQVCLESNVTEILREGGPEGVHVNDIGAKNGQDPQKIGRFLRILANNHIYREVKPNTFANTRISSLLDTLKASKDIFADPEQKHDDTFGFAALASHVLDEVFKASPHAWDNLLDPATARSGDPQASPFARAIGSKESMWQYFERPENAFKKKRFNIGMQGIQALEPLDASLDACDWNALPDNALVVDVGGGVGTSMLAIARDFPKLKIVIQDLPLVIEDAVKFWSREMPDAINHRRVVLEVQDFFDPQPKTDVAVFFLKQILHDWSDEYCTRILTNLRKVATPRTKLILMESIASYSCRHSSAVENEGQVIPGAFPRTAPEPLLANYGSVNEMVYNVDVGMFLLFNAQERTVGHMDELLKGSGWRMTVVHRRERVESTFLQSVEAVPI